MKAFTLAQLPMPPPVDPASASTYADAGVDIDAAQDSLKRIKSLAAKTHGPEVLEGLGGFGGLFAFPTGKYSEPVLVASTDGVGTKLKVAFLTGRHDTIGQDLVNHCVNDILATGGTPLFFLDYYAAGKLDGDAFVQVIGGIALACEQNGCALLGGETAEMPGFYEIGEYDLSGTIIGVGERDHLLTKGGVKKGDLLVGLPSTGLHTNGYSLARKTLLKQWDVGSQLPELQATLGEVLLEIHRSYLHIAGPLLGSSWLHGMAHITGGGLEGNVGRLLDDRLRLRVDWTAWEPLPIFRLIQSVGAVNDAEMRRTFNMGIGWVFVIAPDGLPLLQAALHEAGEKSAVIGEVQAA